MDSYSKKTVAQVQDKIEDALKLLANLALDNGMTDWKLLTVRDDLRHSYDILQDVIDGKISLLK